MKTLVCFDSNALIHRAYHALPPFRTKKGELVNAVYGFISIFLKVIKELKPDYLVATFDLAAPTFRDKEYKEYKAKRVKAPQDLYDQIDRIKQVVRAFTVPIYEKPGYEADDLLGTIVHQSEASGQDVENIIVTGDLDTLQLISLKTKVYMLKRGIKETMIYDKKAVKDRYGIGPKQITDFKGLRGDPSDNIIGVPGIGEKIALDLLKKIGSLEKIYQKIENADLNPRVRAKLLEYKDQAFFSQHLATIKRDVPIRFDLENCAWQKFDQQKVKKLFEELGFYSLINRLPK